jgi:hypothetical protein
MVYVCVWVVVHRRFLSFFFLFPRLARSCGVYTHSHIRLDCMLPDFFSRVSLLGRLLVSWLFFSSFSFFFFFPEHRVVCCYYGLFLSLYRFYSRACVCVYPSLFYIIYWKLFSKSIIMDKGSLQKQIDSLRYQLRVEKVPLSKTLQE